MCKLSVIYQTKKGGKILDYTKLEGIHPDHQLQFKKIGMRNNWKLGTHNWLK